MSEQPTDDFTIEEIEGAIPEPPPEVLDRLTEPEHGEQVGGWSSWAAWRRRVRKATRKITASATPDAKSRGWGTPGDAYRSNIVKVTARGITVYMHREVATIFALLIVDLDNHLRSFGKTLASRADDWGYASRYIKGTTTWSNHAWGLAGDFNAVTNPQKNPLTTEFSPGWIRNLLSGRYRGQMRWGGDYGGTKDPMHFEYIGTPAQARALAAALKPQPTHPHAMPTLRRGVTGSAVRDLQGHLNAAYVTSGGWTPLRITSVFDAQTELSVKRFQNSMGLPITGVVDSTVWTALHKRVGTKRLNEDNRGY